MEYLGIWESVYNPDFNYGEFAIIKSRAGLNSYKLSVKEWVEKPMLLVLKPQQADMEELMRILTSHLNLECGLAHNSKYI
jgi:hypothetical protein